MTRTKANLPISPPKAQSKTRSSQKLKAAAATLTRVMTPERGIVITSKKHGDIESWFAEDITKLGWELFVEPPRLANADFVMDFLDALKEESLPTVTIQGVTVNFTHKEINEAYNLDNVSSKDDAYENYLARRGEPEAAAEVLKEICYEGAKWRKSESLKRISLKYEAKVWMHFINSRIIPGSHDSSVTWDRAVCVFCICTKKKFNVGKIISKQLAANAKRKTAFYFPCLVSDLCRRAKLKPPHPDAENVIPASPDIDQSTLKRVRENEGAEEQEETVDGDEEEGKEDEEVEMKEGEGESSKMPTVKGTPGKTKPPLHKTTAGRVRKAADGTTVAPPGMTLLGAGFETLARQVSNIEAIVCEEYQEYKQAFNQSLAENKLLLNNLEERVMGASEPATKKKKKDAAEEGSSESVKEMMRELTNAVNKLMENALAKEGEQEKEREGWSTELTNLKQEITAMKERELQWMKFHRDFNAVLARNWSQKFRGQDDFPAFPDILPPEALTSAPTQGANPAEEEQ